MKYVACFDHRIVRNCIDATSQCFGCICEILDFWWPTDAPNCLKKEIVRAMSKKKQQEDEVMKDVGTQTSESGDNEDITQTPDNDVPEEMEGKEENVPSYPTKNAQTTFMLLVISVIMLLMMKMKSQ